MQAAEAHGALRARLAQVDPAWAAGVRILYGGSVGGDNIEDFLAVDDVDGALVGGASLKPEAFAPIIAAGAPA